VIARDIAAKLGGARRSGLGWWDCRCPTHHDRSPSLTLRDDADCGVVVHCRAGCDWRDILAELRRRGLLDRPAEDRPYAGAGRPIERSDDADIARRIAAAGRLWDAARDACGSPVVRYLADRRITLAPPSSLRWAPRCWHREARAYLPAMVARVEHVERGFVGCHRTYLTADYRRRDRASLGPIGGGAVRLSPVGETLMIGEGIETCLSAMQACALPAWAALSTSGMVTLALPPVVCTVVILADHDESGAGERAACVAADRWLAEGRRVRIAIPPKPGIDFADVLLGRSYALITEGRNVAA
jgi:putative DNA primase/helicase